MLNSGPSLLIVDDEPAIRTSMSLLLGELGFHVRAASDGFTALTAIQQQMPEIILSDLNMPGMSGFEFLTVVRHNFPAIRVIAMSGAFHGDEVPSGVAADAFYQKGSSIACLLSMLGGHPHMERVASRSSYAAMPNWSQSNA